MRRFSTRFIAVLTAFSLGIMPLTPALAQSTAPSLDPGFDPNKILDDRDIFDISMTREELERFLSSRGALGRILVTDIDGVDKRPAEIIWRVATSYKINPKYLLALLQKEQSLVEDTSPNQRQLDWATGFAVCDSCSMDDPIIQAYKGFANQLEYAAKQHRERYLLQLLGGRTTVSGYAPGITKTVSGMEITPKNNATAMLYTYTPHVHGNQNLWRIWRRWFSRDLPDGTLVRGKSSKQVYLIRFGSKRPFRSLSVLASLANPSKVIEAEDSSLEAYPTGKVIAFANYSIIETPGDKRYLINGEQKRLIASKEVFRKLGFVEDEITEATEEDALAYENGSDITSSTQFPTGIMARDPKGGIWYVEDGSKSRIPHPALLTLYFKGRTPRAMTQVQIEALENRGNYVLRSGELVRAKTHPAVYVVENGTLRPITSAAIFENMGWQWRNVVTLPDDFIQGYVVGSTIEKQDSPSLLTSL